MTRGLTGKKLLKFVSLVLFFGIIISYGIWKGRDLIFGIRLIINGVQDNETVTSPILELSGNAYHAISITVDGRIVSVEEDGGWHDTIALQNGYNIISISSKDKFNRTINKTFTVNYNGPPDKIVDIPIQPYTSSSSATSTKQK